MSMHISGVRRWVPYGLLRFGNLKAWAVPVALTGAMVGFVAVNYSNTRTEITMLRQESAARTQALGAENRALAGRLASAEGKLNQFCTKRWKVLEFIVLCGTPEATTRL